LIEGGMLAARRELDDIERELALRRPPRAMARSA
jgi:hypothetical protein